MDTVNEQTKITIRELQNTWGCAWVDEGGDNHYGFDKDCPVDSGARLWLQVAEGDAVSLLIRGKLAEIVEVGKGAYGGEKCTVRVDIQALNAACERYWDRLNAQGRKEQEQRESCHYCGQAATKLGFFGEAVCEGCG